MQVREHAQVEAEKATPVIPIKRHTNIWDQDGDVVLQAEGTQFRVRRSVLVGASFFFEGAFFSAEQGVDFVEKCPVLRVFDAAKDWEVMFEYLCRPLRPLPFGIDPSTGVILVKDLVSLLRLGKKYHCIRILDEVLGCLKALLPKDIVECNKMYERGRDVTVWCKEREHDILKAVIELRIGTLLPIAYYLCIIRHNMYVSSFDLDNMIVVRLLFGRACISAAVLGGYSDWMKSAKIPSKSCNAQNACKKEVLEWVGTIKNKIDRPHHSYYPLDVWDLKFSPPKFCRACTDVARAEHRKDTEQLWKNLPSYFGLPDWKDLKDFD